jgi:hypothetical protein
MRATVIKYSFSEFARAWFRGEISEELMMGAVESAQFGLDVVRRYHGKQGRNAVMVTHDWNIMVLKEHYLGLRHEDVGFPGFLGGVGFYKNEDGTFLSAAGKTAAV